MYITSTRTVYCIGVWLNEIRFLREQIVLKNIIVKSLFTGESASRDKFIFSYKVECIKNDKKNVSVLQTHLTVLKEIAIKTT